VQKSYPRWIEFLYGPLFKVIGFFYRTYTANRARLESLKANAKVAVFFKLLAVAVLVGWILIWLFASDASRTRLTDEVKQSIGGFAPGTNE
jgi:hypothetical protein